MMTGNSLIATFKKSGCDRILAWTARNRCNFSRCCFDNYAGRYDAFRPATVIYKPPQISVKHYSSKSKGFDNPCMTSPYRIVSFGNVLLDTTARINEHEAHQLEGYHLKPNSKGELPADVIHKLTEDVCKMEKCKQTPGGSVLNTNRFLQQLGIRSLFIGSVGKDETAKKLRNLLKEMHVDARLKEADTPTGKCISIINKDTGAEMLYANIGASAKLNVAHLKLLESKKHLPYLRPSSQKQLLYLEGFFVPHHKEVCQYIVENYVMGKRKLALNLSAEYIVKTDCKDILHLAKKATIVFGNFIEFAALSNVVGIPCVQETARALLLQAPDKIKMVVITHDSRKVELVTNYVDACSPPGELRTVTVGVKTVKKVLDPTGAGDAFVAGFLYGYFNNHPLEQSIHMGNKVAQEVIQQIGCKLPENFEIEKV